MRLDDSNVLVAAATSVVVDCLGRLRLSVEFVPGLDCVGPWVGV